MVPLSIVWATAIFMVKELWRMRNVLLNFLRLVLTKAMEEAQVSWDIVMKLGVAYARIMKKLFPGTRRLPRVVIPQHRPIWPGVI